MTDWILSYRKVYTMKEHLLIPIAPGQGIDQRYDVAFEFADANHCQVTLLSVLDDLQKIPLPVDSNGSAFDFLTMAERQTLRHLNSLIESLADLYRNVSFASQVASGVAQEQILIRAKELPCSMLVFDAHSRFKSSAACFGSTTRALMRKSPVPVWVLGKNNLTKASRIGVAIDFGNREKEASTIALLSAAFKFSQQSHAQLHLFHIWHLEGESHLRHWAQYSELEIANLAKQERNACENKLTDLVRNVDHDGRDYQLHLIEGRVKEQMANFIDTQNIEILFIHTTARSGIAGAILGNTAESTLDQVNCSVITVKAPN